MNDVKIAIIGAGSMAREHIRAFQAVEGVQVSGLFSRTRERAEKLAAEFNIPIVTNSIQELYEQSQANCVIVAVPELQANSVAKQCFQHNWVTLLEKPAGYDLFDASDIAEAALQAKRPVYVGFNRRFNSSSLQVLADINSRDESRYVHVQDQQNFLEARKHNHPEEIVKKFMYANSVHTIDLIRYFCRGEIKQVQPILPWKQEQSQIVLSFIEFESGDKALYEGIWQGPGPWACAVSTPGKRWTMQPLEKATYQNANERQTHEVEIDKIDGLYKAGFYRQAQEICKAVRGETHQAVTIQDSLKTMELINKIFEV